MTKVVGIDICRMKACVAVMEKQPIVIANKQGDRTIPAIIAYTPDGTPLIGEAAQAQSLHDPANGFHSVMQFLGRRYDEVADAINRVPYQVLSDGKGGILLNCPNLPEPLPPEAVLAPLLRRLADNASAYLDEEVTQVVLTVPTDFLDAQRMAMRSAAQLAGLEALRVINDSAAACLTYHSEQENETGILVLSLNHSILKVAVLEAADTVFEVLVTRTLDFSEHEANSEQRNRLLAHCCECIQQAISEAQLRSAYGNYQVEISNVVLVGDAGRSPTLSALVQQLTNITPLQKYPSDEIVGMGAAIQARVLEGMTYEFVCPLPEVAYRLGVETSDGMMFPLIERGSSFPISRTMTFSTAFDGQTSVEIPILRGLRVLAKDNQRLQTLSLNGLLPAPQGVPKIEVTFVIDMNEILEVIAKDCATGETVSTMLPWALSLNRAEFDQLYGDALKNEAADAAIDPAKFRRDVADVIQLMHEELHGVYFRGGITAIDISKLKGLIETLQLAMKPLENSNCLKSVAPLTALLPIETTTALRGASLTKFKQPEL